MTADADLLRDLQTIERRLAERLVGRRTIRYGDEGDYGAWISPHGVIIDVGDLRHGRIARAILLDVGLVVDVDYSSGPLAKMGFIRIVYPDPSAGPYGRVWLSIDIFRRPTEAQHDALARVVRAAHRIKKQIRTAIIDMPAPCGHHEVAANLESIRAAIEECQ